MAIVFDVMEMAINGTLRDLSTDVVGVFLYLADESVCKMACQCRSRPSTMTAQCKTYAKRRDAFVNRLRAKRRERLSN
jgi:hypothetical protein